MGPQSPFARSRFLEDDASHALALHDALRSGDPASAARAFEAVALACGMSQLAADTGIARDILYAALDDPARPDLPTLTRAAEALARR